MGPTLARMARRALDDARRADRVIAVSRFSTPDAAHALRTAGVETVACDLLDRDAVRALPQAPNVIFLAGQKFGTAGAPALTWALNTLVPAIVAERYTGARIVALSTGNVYPLVPASSAGAREDLPPAPVGEYAASCLGRERLFENWSARTGTPVAIVRLNYAVELRYGVLVDIARKVQRGEPVDVTMGRVNVIWQGDACARILQCLPIASTPPLVLNVTGPESLSVRSIAQGLGTLLGRPPVLTGTEAPDALLSDASASVARFGPPAVSVGQMMAWIADWLARGGRTLDKPTHFEEREGRF
jgi:nucleoside-diphosphate-sugar epimerase